MVNQAERFKQIIKKEGEERIRQKFGQKAVVAQKKFLKTVRGGGGGTQGVVGGAPTPSPTTTKEIIPVAAAVTTPKAPAQTIPAAVTIQSQIQSRQQTQQGIQEVIRQEGEERTRQRFGQKSVEAQRRLLQTADTSKQFQVPVGERIPTIPQESLPQSAIVVSEFQQPQQPSKVSSVVNVLGSSGVIGLSGSQFLFKRGRGELQRRFGGELSAETRKEFIGFGTPGLPTFTSKQVNIELRKKGLGGKIAGEIIPETPEGIAAFGIGAAVFKAVPPVVRLGADVFFAQAGARAALDPSLPVEKRIVGGAVGALATAGFVSEVAPFVKGAATRLRPSFKSPEVQPVGKTKFESKLFGKQAKAIKVKQDFDIRFIEEGRGFGFSQTEQKAFIGRKVTATTGQRGFIAGGGKATPVLEGEAGMGLFLTPTPKEFGAVRTSRLGLANVKDLFKLPPKDTTFTFKRQDPQIIFLKDVPVTKAGGLRTARAVGFPSSELEVTILPGAKITGKQVGVTTIKGQPVKIFEGFIQKGGPKARGQPTFDVKGFDVSSALGEKTFVPPSGALSTAVGTTKLVSPTLATSISTPTRPPSRRSLTSLTSPVSPSSRTRTRITPGVTSSIAPSRPPVSPRRTSPPASVPSSFSPPPRRQTPRRLPSSIPARSQPRFPQRQALFRQRFKSPIGLFGDTGRIRKRIKARKQIPQPQAFVPSLTASVLGIKAKRKPFLVRRKGKGVFAAGFTPGVRPIVKSPRKRKRFSLN